MQQFPKGTHKLWNALAPVAQKLQRALSLFTGYYLSYIPVQLFIHSNRNPYQQLSY